MENTNGVKVMISRRSILFVVLLCAGALAGCSSGNPQVLIKTEMGDIRIELYEREAPITVGNFLRYVNEGRFRGSTFYRVVRTGPKDNQPDNKVKIQVLQGGLQYDDHPQKLPPIAHETTVMTGLTHKNGTLSMARYGPGTADFDFSICIGDQPELDFGGKRNPDGVGFAAFGQVLQGMDVVRKIHAQPAQDQMLKPEIKITDMILLNDRRGKTGR